MHPELLWGSVTLQLTHVSCQELENVGALQFIEKPASSGWQRAETTLL